MGGKNSKREGPCGSIPTRGIPSTKVSRSRSLPIKVFNRKPDTGYGYFLKERLLQEDVDDIDEIEEYRRLVELENLHRRDQTGLCVSPKQDFTRSCISSLRSSREEIIYEEEYGDEDDFVANVNKRRSKGESLKASPVCTRGRSRSRLSAQSAPYFGEYLGEADGIAGACFVPENVLIQPDTVVDTSSVGENPLNPPVEAIGGSEATSQEDLLGLANCDAKQSEVPSATKSVDNSLSVESLSFNGGSKLNSQLSCIDTGSGASEGCSSSQTNYSTIRKDDRSTCSLTDSFGTAVPLNGAYSDVVLTEALDYITQIHYSVKPRTWRRLKRNNFSRDKVSDNETSDRGTFGCKDKEGMTGKDEVKSFINNSGKRQQDTQKAEFTDTVDMDLNSSSGKRMKDRVGEEALSDIQPDAFAWGLVGESDPFLGPDAAGLLGKAPALGDQISGASIKRSSSKISKGAALVRRVRGLRASPKPVTSLESCLRAQMADPLGKNRAKSVFRPLKFLSSTEKGSSSDASMAGYIAAYPSSNANTVDEINYKSELSAASTGLPRLTNLSKFLKDYAVKLAMTSEGENGDGFDTNLTILPANYLGSSSSCNGNNKKIPLPVLIKKRKVSDSRRFLPNGAEHGLDRSSTQATTFETLLFSFGVALGVLFGASPHKMEVLRLNHLLDETQANLEALKLEPGARKSPVRTNDSEAVKRSQYEIQQQDQMAELEAELEAELDQLTGRESAAMESQYSVLDELDMDGVASVVYGDLEPTGLPAGVEEDSEDDLSALAQPACLNNYAVSPRELTRLLRKLQKARQEELITELEGELEATQSKLEIREKELEMWKNRVRRFTEVSFGSGSGSGSVDECATPDKSTMSFALVNNSSIIREATRDLSVAVKGDEECILSSLQANGYEVDKHLVGSGPHLEPVLRGELKTGLRHEPANQGPQDIRSSPDNGLAVEDDVSYEFLQSMIEFEDERPFQGEVASRDCRPILDNAQLITQLIDSVHELDSHGACGESVEMCSVTPSVGPFSSSASIADAWEHPLDSATFEGRLFPQSKLAVPYPSRRVSYNSDSGQPAIIRCQDNGSLSSQADHGLTIRRYPEVSESLKSVSDMSGIENADHKTCEASFSAKYKNSTMRPASELKVSGDGNPSSWVGVGRAGLTTPVENETKLFKAPQNLPVQWPGEVTPTVQEKIARWESLMEGETPGPAPGADWECQSRASETTEQQDAANFEYDDNVFSEDNLLFESEEILGRMLVQRIVEKSKHAADSLVKKAQTALATLERNDGIEADLYYGGDTYMDERTDSEVGSSQKASELKESWYGDQEKDQTGFLDDGVREEIEFFRRLDVINKDRKTKLVLKNKAAMKEIVGSATALESDLESDSQLSPELFPGSPRSGVLEEDSANKKYAQQVDERSFRGSRDAWPSPGHARQYTPDRGIGDRRDEVRSRRR